MVGSDCESQKVENGKNLLLLLKRKKRNTRRKINRKERQKNFMKIMKSQKENEGKGDVERKW